MKLHYYNKTSQYEQNGRNEYKFLCEKQKTLSKKIIKLELIPEKSFRGVLLPKDLPYNIPPYAKPWVCALYNEIDARFFNAPQQEPLTQILMEVKADYLKQQETQFLPPFEKIICTSNLLSRHSVLDLKKMALARESSLIADKIASLSTSFFSYKKY